MKGSYLGPSYSHGDIEAFLEGSGAPYRRLPRREVIEKAARALANEKVVGWFQGRMEFGPRALGARSILGDPQSSKMQSLMNLKNQVPRELSALRALRAAGSGRGLLRNGTAIRLTCYWSHRCAKRSAGR